MKRIVSFILATGILLSNIWSASALAIEDGSSIKAELVSQEEEVMMKGEGPLANEDSDEIAKEETSETLVEKPSSSEEEIDTGEADMENTEPSDEEDLSEHKDVEIIEAVETEDENILQESIDGPIESLPSGLLNYGVLPISTISDFMINAGNKSKSPSQGKIGVDHPKSPGEVMVFKEAKAVEGRVNTWEITTRVEAKNKAEASDLILVVDRSGSMAAPIGKITGAKKTAKELAKLVLSSGNNRVGVVSFAGDVEINQRLSNSYDDLELAIDGIAAGEGTFTQAAIRQAGAMLDNSDLANKNIVLISDGEPSYSYALVNPDSHEGNSAENVIASYGSQGNTRIITGREMTSSLVESQFDYPNPVGEGTATRHLYNYPMSTNMYNHGKSAIAEAGFVGNKGYSIFTIGLDTSQEGNTILEEISQGNGTFTNLTDTSQLMQVVEDIGSKVCSVGEFAVRDLLVEDEIGKGFEISEENISKIRTSQGEAIYKDNSIKWSPGTLAKEISPGSAIKYAELKYIVEINDDISEASNDKDSYPIANKSSLTYIDLENKEKSGVFPIPAVDPLICKLSEEIIDEDGKVINQDEDLEISILGPDDYKKTLLIASSEDNKATELTDIRSPGKYTIKEEKKTEVSYLVNGEEKDEFTVLDSSEENIDIQLIGKKANKGDIDWGGGGDGDGDGDNGYDPGGDSGSGEQPNTDGKYIVNLFIKLLNSEDDKPIEGAEFKIDNSTGLDISKKTDKDGLVRFVDVRISPTHYHLTQVVKDGFVEENKKWYFEIKEGKETGMGELFLYEDKDKEKEVESYRDDKGNKVYKIYNMPEKPGFELPTTGGRGTLAFTVIGGTLATISLFNLYKKKKSYGKDQ